MLVDDFEHRTLFDLDGPRPISLRELQDAIEAAAPPLSPEPGPTSPLRTSTPLPAPGEAAAAAPDQPTPDATASTELALVTPAAHRRERKRRHKIFDINDIIEGGLKLHISEGECDVDTQVYNRWTYP